ncbi:MAG: hypothetical protein QXZ68_05925, partial [Candidatus Bathyarchaeia archaeon]
VLKLDEIKSFHPGVKKRYVLKTFEYAFRALRALMPPPENEGVETTIALCIYAPLFSWVARRRLKQVLLFYL